MKVSRDNLQKMIREIMLESSRDFVNENETDKDKSGDLSPDELRDIADDLKGTSEFASTAAEEAQKINQQVQGAAYPTDQAYWEKVGISTGEDLAKSVLAQTYSDAYKSMHGTRPRLPFSDMSVEQIQTAIKSLDDDWYEMRHYEDQAWKDNDPKYIARGKAIEAEYEADKAHRAEEEELERMKEPEEGEEYPKQTGMRRGKVSETKMKITRKQLKQMIGKTLNEATMVSLKPITPSNAETQASLWAKLSGIPEEHVNLSESIMDTTPMEDLMANMIGEIVDRFGNEMERLWDEDPAMMRKQGYADRSQWTRQVGSAELVLEDELQQVMSQTVQNVETQLHDGQFYDERDSRSSMGGRDSNNDGKLDADELRDIADDLEG